MPKAVLFDFDGTLCDSIGVVYRAVTHVFGHYRLAPPTRERFASQLTYPYYQNYRQWGLLECLASDADIDRLHRSAVKPEEMHLFPEVAEVLEFLAWRGIFLGVVSANLRERVEAILRETRLDCAITRIEGEQPDKAHAISLCMRDYGLKPQDLVYVGDSVDDIEGARKAGVRAIGIAPRGIHGRITLRQAGAERVVTDLYELLDVLEL